MDLRGLMIQQNRTRLTGLRWRDKDIVKDKSLFTALSLCNNFNDVTVTNNCMRGHLLTLNSLVKWLRRNVLAFAVINQDRTINGALLSVQVVRCCVYEMHKIIKTLHERQYPNLFDNWADLSLLSCRTPRISCTYVGKSS